MIRQLELEVKVSNIKYIENAFKIYQIVKVLEIKLKLIYYELINNIFKEIKHQLILRYFRRSDSYLINFVKTYLIF